MPHNPILRRQAIGRLDLRFVVEHNTAGVLYQGQRYLRLLQPGEGPSLHERTSPGELMVYVIDTTPHTLVWRVGLPSQINQDIFSTTVTLRYQVNNFRRIVDEQVTDTEVLIRRVIEPILRKEARRFKLNHYAKADAAMEEAIQQADLLTLCGLQLIDSPNIVINLTENDHRRIKILNDLERAMRVALTAEHVEELPTSEPSFKFQVKVNVSYKVQNVAELSSDSLEEVEKQLWPKLKRTLRRVSQKYTVTQIAQADTEMQNVLDKLFDEDGVEGFGLKMLEAEVSTDLDERARLHYIALANVAHTTALEKAKLEGLKESTAFYTDLIQKGDWAVLAVAVSKDEISVDELYHRLSQQDRERLQMQIDLLKTLRADNAKDEKQDYNISQILIENIATKVTSRQGPQGPALGAPQEKPQLTDSQQSEGDQKQ